MMDPVMFWELQACWTQFGPSDPKAVKAELHPSRSPPKQP